MPQVLDKDSWVFFGVFVKDFLCTSQPLAASWKFLHHSVLDNSLFSYL